MFYSLPVLKGVLPNPYLTHFSLLVSGLWLLSSDHITQEDLRLAKECLLHFYKEFGDLYGKHAIIQCGAVATGTVRG